MKKVYERPDIYVEEYELENIAGNLCSGAGDIPIYKPPGDESE